MKWSLTRFLLAGFILLFVHRAEVQDNAQEDIQARHQAAERR